MTAVRVAVPVGEVRSVATRDSDPGRTRTFLGGIVLGGAALWAAFFLVVASSDN